MESFNKILSEVKKPTRAHKILLKEGGNAVPGVTRINQDNVEATLNRLYRDIKDKLHLSKFDVVVVGSTGKKKSGESSGDIDVAISIKSLLQNYKMMNQVEIFDLLYNVGKTIGKAATKNPNLISFSYKIENTDGLQENSYVQVDFFLTDSLEYSSWAYYAPSYSESSLKGIYRNILIGQLLKAISTEVTKTSDGEDIEQTKLVFDTAKGLVKNWQTRVGKKGILKNWQTIAKDLITASPDEIAKLILGDQYSHKDALTFENIVKIVRSSDYKYKSSRAEIFALTKKALVDLGLPIPESL